MSLKWSDRLTEANLAYENWENEFQCRDLYRFYKGKQWQIDDIQLRRPYVYNLFASTIDINIAGLQFSSPRFKVDPRPGALHDYKIDMAAQSAQLKEDVLSAITSNKKINFAGQLKLALLDSCFRFGIVETGYANDFRNPITDFPESKSWSDKDIGEGSDGDKQVGKVASLNPRDRFYIKRIPAKRFRVSKSDSHFLEDQEWVGYYSWEYISTLKNTKGIKFPDSYGGATTSSSELGGGTSSLSPLSTTKDTCKVWHIWDQVSKTRLLYLDGYDEECLWEEDFDNLPLSVLRWRLLLEDDENKNSCGFYPKPLTYDWLSIQQEINECREQERSLRRRFIERFQVMEGSIDPDEIRKFAAGDELISVKQMNAIQPMGNVGTSASGWENLKVSESEFNIISGTSAAARGAADRETATQAKLIQAQSQIRENFNQVEYGNFVSSIGDNLLKVAESHMDDGIWVKLTIPEDQEMLALAQQQAPLYKFIQNNNIKDGIDYEVSISVENATPATIQADQQAFLTFVSLVSQNPFLAANPILIREAALKVGYRNEKVVGQMQQAALQAIMAKTVMAAKQQGVNSDNLQKEQLAQSGTPTNVQADHQLQQQMAPQ